MGQSTHETFTAIRGSDFNAALRLSQKAPTLLGRQLSSATSFLSIFGSTSENPEQFGIVEQLMLACLRTGDDKSAKSCLDFLTKRFGPSNERIMGLRGLYEEAIAENSADLEKCLHEYEKILVENPVNVPILKRRAALLRSMSRPADAISALIELLEAMPTDAEAWCELSDLYQSQGMSSQAVFSLEEALLIAPHSWNLHAHVGELLYISASNSEVDEITCKLLGRSVRFFSRSIELCEDYLRGLYGLILATSLLLKNKHFNSLPWDDSVSAIEQVPAKGTLEKLKMFAIEKLGNIVKSRSSAYEEWEYGQSELIAAKELLNSMTQLDELNK